MYASSWWNDDQINEAGQILAQRCAEYCAVKCSTARVTPTTLCFVSLSPLPRRHVMIHGTTSIIVTLQFSINTPYTPYRMKRKVRTIRSSHNPTLTHYRTAVILTHSERVTQICVFNTRLFSLHNTLKYAIHRSCLRMVLLTDVYRNLTSP